MATTLSPNPSATATRQSSYGLDNHGIRTAGEVFWNLPPAELIEQAVRRGEGQLVAAGPFNAITAPHTGRSPNDRFVVRNPGTEEEGKIWWGKVNVPFDPEKYRMLREEVVDYLEDRDLFVRDMWAGADPEYRLAVRVVTPNAWHNLFAYNMFRRPDPDELDDFRARLYRDPRPRVQGGPRKARHPLRRLRDPELRRARGADRRDPVRGRDQEIDLFRAELHAPPPEGAFHATALRTSAPRVTRRSFSGFRERARRPSPPTPTAA